MIGYIKLVIKWIAILCTVALFSSSCSDNSDHRDLNGTLNQATQQTTRQRIGRKDILVEASAEPVISLAVISETSAVTIEVPISKLEVPTYSIDSINEIKPLELSKISTVDLSTIDNINVSTSLVDIQETIDGLSVASNAMSSLASIEVLSVTSNLYAELVPIESLNVTTNFTYEPEVIAGLPSNFIHSIVGNMSTLSGVSVTLPHSFEWAAPPAMSDDNAESWSQKVPSYTGFPEVKLQSIKSVFAYGEAIATDNEELYVKQLKRIKHVIEKGYNTIILAYYGGVNPASVLRLIDDIHDSGAKVLFAVSSVEFFIDRETLGFGVSEFDTLMGQVANKIDYFIPSWRGLSPSHCPNIHAFTSAISHMALENNPNLVVFGIADIYSGQISSLVLPGSSAVIIARPVVNKQTMLWISDSSSEKYNAPGAKVICGPVCFPNIYVPQDTNRVEEMEKAFMDNHWGFFRLHGDGHQQNDAMTN